MTSVSGAFPVETSDQNVPCYMLGKSKIITVYFKNTFKCRRNKIFGIRIDFDTSAMSKNSLKIRCFVKFENFSRTTQT